MTDWITGLDWKLLGWAHDTFSSGFWAYVMPKISFIGNYAMVWVLAACLLLCTKRYRWNGVMVLAGLAAGFLIGNLLLKPLIARARPIWPYTPLVPLIPGPGDYSFPSGHALSSFAAATVLALTDRKLGWLSIPLACLIALSRVALYVHFPSDVLAGAILGALDGGCVYWLGRKLASKRRVGKE